MVAKKRDAEDVAANTIRTLQMMQMVAVNTAKRAIDSAQTMIQDNAANTADSTIIQQSIQREEDNTSMPEVKQQVLPVNSDTIAKRIVVKPQIAQSSSASKKSISAVESKKPVVKPVTIKATNSKPPIKKTTKPNPISKPKTTTKNDY